MYRNKKVLIVEDEVLVAEHLKAILKGFNFDNVTMVHNAPDAYDALEQGFYDLVLLDITLGHKKQGLEIADRINETGKTPFIFITAYSDNAILSEALSKHPQAYITKPFKKTDIIAAINLVFIHKPELAKPYLLFKDGKNEVSLKTQNIIYLRSEGNYIDIVTLTKKYSIRNSLEWFLANADENKFMKIHRSYVINLNFIVKLGSSTVLLENIELPVSRKYKNELKKRIKNLLNIKY